MKNIILNAAETIITDETITGEMKAEIPDEVKIITADVMTGMIAMITGVTTIMITDVAAAVIMIVHVLHVKMQHLIIHRSRRGKIFGLLI